MERKNAWNTYDEKALEELGQVTEQYRRFISEGKTERECAQLTVEMAKEHGYISLEEAVASGRQLKAGDKIYAVHKKKLVVLFEIGTEPMEKGMNILGAHIDSPRLDLKQNPLYEDGEMALLDTHYYGGIKKYQWASIPLALHGVVVKKDGTVIELAIGEKAEDPVLGISDLLIHLSGEQMQKKAAVVVEGENLNIIVGSRPWKDPEEKDEEKKELIKKTLLEYLKKEYGMEEEDFLSAELEAVPAGQARDFGLDRSMIMGYGQDDRICGFTSLLAQLHADKPAYTAVCLLTDKEEIGSMGATGMQSRYFENVVAEVLNLTGQYSDLALRRCLQHSHMLSSDVSAAFDPNYASAFEKKNIAYLGRGMVFNKYTGSRGKSGSNDACAEYIGELRKVMDDSNVCWQTAELGKVDQGGGGTIAYITANYGMDVIDSGVALLSMHSPWEISSKADIYEAYKGYKAFQKADWER
ncbi:aminopeptidase [Clostridiaceae bacterium Marseille-Q4145]|nr:aminopeptidase [Clostridiaceae bacterium Marseille-Q4145]